MADPRHRESLPADDERTRSDRIICVLGMHRSGTSLVARVSNLLGLDLGPERRLYGAMDDNPTGMWEYRPFVQINRRILARSGGSWHDPPVFESNWPTRLGLADLRGRARVAILRDFRRSPAWGWKDPRTCLTLPFWKHVLGDLSFVLCTRNPVDVARSLERRNGLPLARGFDLWATYTRLALDQTEGCDRVFVDYETVVQRPQGSVNAIATLIGSPAAAQDPAILEQIDEFRDESLQHSATTPEELFAASDVPEEIKRLYAITHGADGRNGAPGAAADSGSEEPPAGGRELPDLRPPDGRRG